MRPCRGASGPDGAPGVAFGKIESRFTFGFGEPLPYKQKLMYLAALMHFAETKTRLTNRIRHMNQKNALGPLIKEKRKELGLTQRELAIQLGVEASHIAYLENGKRKPSLKLMARLEDALGVSGQQIFLLSHPEAASVVNLSERSSSREQRVARSRRPLFVRALIKRHRITRRELQAFEGSHLLGYILSQHQVLTILTMIRDP
jgi:transcriptional regulator with XRE-family HTH domain